MAIFRKLKKQAFGEFHGVSVNQCTHRLVAIARPAGKINIQWILNATKWHKIY